MTIFKRCSLIAIVSFYAITSFATPSQGLDPFVIQVENETRQKWKDKNYSFVEERKDLVSSALLAYEIIRKIPKSILQRAVHHRKKQLALFYYNFLRHLLSKPTAASVDDIDETWLDEVKKATDYFMILEKSNYIYIPANPYQRKLFHDAKHAIDLQEDIELFSGRDYGETRVVEFSGVKLGDVRKNIVQLTICPDFDFQLGTAYHELAHIKYGDYGVDKDDLDVISSKLESSEFQEPLEKIQSYLAIGKTAFDNRSRLGKHLNEILAQHSSFWDAPTTPETYKKVFYSRAKEQRADLFALETLLIQQKINSIVAHLERYGHSDIVAGAKDTHPSGVERALYFAGFLTAHKIDVNALLADFEEQGVCTPIESVYEEGLPYSQGFTDFQAAYTLWLNSPAGYQKWKTMRTQKWPSPWSGLTLSEKFNLLLTTELAIEDLKEMGYHDEYQREALNSYNLLREIYKASAVSSVNEVSARWLEDIYYEIWREKTDEQLLKDGNSEEKKIQSILRSFVFNLRLSAETVEASASKEEDRLEKIAKKIAKKWALFDYNYLREKKGLPLASSFQFIDKKWLKELEDGADGAAHDAEL